MRTITDIHEISLIADGVVPLYSGCPSARLTSLGGRYDYVYDVHNRLIRADYTSGILASEEEDFSTEYEYNELGSPNWIKRNGIYVHRTNKNGYAGETKKGGISTGCLLIKGTEWPRFSKQIGKHGFKLILNRTK